MSLIAVTGGTGFVGGHLLRSAAEAGHRIRALARRPQEEREGVEWVGGALDDRAALDALVRDADAVIHVAGAISANDRDGFWKANVEGTRNLVEAAGAADVGRVLHVSSLAAREPGVSDYGWSKAEAEAVVSGSGLDWTIVRPPAVYGPGDRETLELFRMARRGLVTLPPEGRISIIHVHDLAGLLLASLDAPPSYGALYEPHDGTETGVSHRQFAEALGRAVGRKVRSIAIPAPLVRAGARLDRLLRGENAKLTPDRARYFCHPDWVADGHKGLPEAVWAPSIPLERGLKDTAEWYRAQGWLRR